MSAVIFANFFFNDTATTEIYALSLHDALPIWPGGRWRAAAGRRHRYGRSGGRGRHRTGRRRGRRRDRRGRPEVSKDNEGTDPVRSEEHTSELQSPCNLVCRLLLEKKNDVSSDLC